MLPARPSRDLPVTAPAPETWRLGAGHAGHAGHGRPKKLAMLIPLYISLLFKNDFWYTKKTPVNSLLWQVTILSIFQFGKS